MPRPFHLIVFLVVLASAQAEAQVSCNETLDVGPAPDGKLSFSLAAPCRPYAAVTLEYGPFAIDEETSDRGDLRLNLPMIQGADKITARFTGSAVTTALPQPAADASTPFIALEWRETPGFAPDYAGVSHESHERLGFPTHAGAGRHYLYYYVDGLPRTDVLDIRIEAAQCGRDVTASLITSANLQPRQIGMTLPECGAGGLKFRIPLGQ